ncbi:MAG TPA: hypothetical protein VK911_12665 [Vicinamibacterales bacterium]|nr:hypothetical protein [Vicinamibacterales bacterium]
MAKKTTAGSQARKTAAPETGAKRKKSAPASEPKAGKHVGDVLGISRARVPKEVPRATSDRGGRPKGIELPARRKPVKRAGVVGGVRGRGR